MGTTDPRVDAYIEKSADFAKPILEHIRALVHEYCPMVVETTKWGFPHFEYGGILCSMASFKAHCAFGFWRASEILENASDGAMGQFGRIVCKEDLPPKKVIGGYIRKAMELNESGTKPVRKRATTTRNGEELPVPDDLKRALANNRSAEATFDGFSPSHRREYLEWIAEARTESTRQRRIDTAVEWMSDGKHRNWKYKRRT